MNIYQSSNKSLQIDIKQELLEMPEVNVTLSVGGKELKHWVWYKTEYDAGVDQDIHLSETVLTLDFTQEETARFDTGNAIVDIKYLDEDGVVQMYEYVSVQIVKRQNTHIMGVS